MGRPGSLVGWRHRNARDRGGRGRRSASRPRRSRMDDKRLDDAVAAAQFSSDCMVHNTTPSPASPKSRSAPPTRCYTARTTVRSTRPGLRIPIWRHGLHRRTPPVRQARRCSPASVAKGTIARARIRGVSMPTLVIHGERDPLPLAESLPESYIATAQLVVVPAAGHMPFWEAPHASSLHSTRSCSPCTRFVQIVPPPPPPASSV